MLLPNGLSLPVELGDERAAWLVLDTPIGGGHTLDYTNLRPWATPAPGSAPAPGSSGGASGGMLVLFGPAGTRGVLSIDDAPAEVDVPSGKSARGRR